MQHSPISPSILYWGTPVVLVTTRNPDGSSNVAPISSAFWLMDRCMLGLLACSRTTTNLVRERQCVLNLPSDDMIPHVNALARTTGDPDVPRIKRALGYAHDADKFRSANLTPQASEFVRPPRVKECPVQMEAELVAVHAMQGGGGNDGDGTTMEGATLAIEVRVLRTYVTEALRMPGFAHRVDPDAWRPMIMSFQQLYGLRDRREESKLAEISEELYRP